MKNIILFNKKSFFVAFLFLFSFLINQHYGNRGIFPIDSFLIFDAAYNITLGNHPFKDYWLITGPFLDYTQALLFLMFGINWFSYVLHASLLNVLFTLFSFYFFLNIGLRNLYAFIYSVGISILAYPPIGTPFIDSHAIIFCVLSLYSLSLGILLKKNLFWFLVPFFVIFSFFSKQIPSSYLVFLFFIVIIFCFFFLKNIKKENLLYLLLGIIFSLLLVSSIFFINQIPVKNFLVQYIFYPFSLGEDRINKLDLNSKNLVYQFKFIYLTLLPLAISTFILFKKKKKYKRRERVHYFIAFFIFYSNIYLYTATNKKSGFYFLFNTNFRCIFSCIYNKIF